MFTGIRATYIDAENEDSILVFLLHHKAHLPHPNNFRVAPKLTHLQLTLDKHSDYKSFL